MKNPVISLKAVALLLSGVGAFQIPHAEQHIRRVQKSNVGSKTAVLMKPVSSTENEIISDNRVFSNNKIKQKVPYSPRTSLSAASLDSSERASSLELLLGIELSLPQEMRDFHKLRKNESVKFIAQVLSASLLVTGNTVGSGMFVLPEAVGGVGMVCGCSIFFGLYLFNLISGLMLAEVAINLHENSDCEVPSSFKDFADAAMPDNAFAGNAIGASSLLLNGSILSFGIVHAGNLLATTFPELGIDPAVAASAYTAMIAANSVTQTNDGLKNIANAAVMVLFSSFATLLFPSLTQVQDPIGTLLAPGNHPGGVTAGVSAALPLLFSVLIFQNIVPSLTKLLNFDRTKVTASIAIGSAIPMFMYIAWCYAVLGGGLDSSISGGNAALFTTFSAAALVGSSTACVMSLAEEFESIIGDTVGDAFVESGTDKDRFSLPAVALSIAPPALLALAFANGGDFTGALHFGGAFISPFLYGILPIMLFRSMGDEDNQGSFDSPFSDWNIPQVCLGAGTFGFLVQEICHDFASLEQLMS
ncbi:hypothetical protein ACHAXS_012785 [Conticribra weissflogii]